MFDIFKPSVNPDETPLAVHWPARIEWDSPSAAGYRASPELAHAVNAAIQLGKPLLVTGEPGTGKTQLAYGVAYQLSRLQGLHFDPQPLRFDTKSNSVAQDLFYNYDLLGRYADARIEGNTTDKEKFLSINAMGTAIIWTWGQHELNARLKPDLRREEARRAVVLIDEIDKAPRDFPNDLLNELEAFEFWISELDRKVVCRDATWRPLVIITSNSEKNLPDAFLRRCVYHHIEFPDQDELAKIVALRLSGILQPFDPNVARAADLFFTLRAARPPLEKKPGTAEFLNWLTVISRMSPDGGQFFAPTNAVAVKKSLSTLIKTKADTGRSWSILEQWFESRSNQSGA